MARIPFGLPDRSTLVDRLAAVRRVIYLIFSEGHTSTSSAPLIRGDLCDEATWLAELLATLVPDDPEVRGLAALVLLIDARRDSRIAEGSEVLLADQDRGQWDQELIERGLDHLGHAHAMGAPGPLQLQAAIASLHATAATFEQTNWAAIVRLYDALLRRESSALVALNRAVAVSYLNGPAAGLALLDELSGRGEIENYLYYHTTRAELLARSDRPNEAGAAFTMAMGHCTNVAQKERLLRRRAAMLLPDKDDQSVAIQDLN